MVRFSDPIVGYPPRSRRQKIFVMSEGSSFGADAIVHPTTESRITALSMRNDTCQMGGGQNHVWLESRCNMVNENARAMLDDFALWCLSRSVLCWLATTDESGQPNVSPKEIFDISNDSYLLIANIASPKSASNIRRNSAVCVSFVDVFVQKGMKIYGSATVLHSSDPQFAELARPLQDMAGDRFKFSSLFRVEMTSVEPIIAPSYRLYPETQEADQVASAMKRYGVRPLSD